MPSDLKPTTEQALLFAQLLEVCVPSYDAIGYVAPELEEVVRPELARKWERDPKVKAARFDYRDWLTKSTDDRATYAVTRTYNGMAIFLATHNIGELETAKLAKAKDFLAALERKLAGLAGKGDATAQFWADVLAGKVQLAPKTPERVQ